MVCDPVDRAEDRLFDETLRNWVRRAERDAGQRAGPISDDLAPLKALERENTEVYGVCKVWRQLNRAGVAVARCPGWFNGAWLMVAMSLAGAVREKHDQASLEETRHDPARRQET